MSLHSGRGTLVDVNINITEEEASSLFLSSLCNNLKCV